MSDKSTGTIILGIIAIAGLGLSGFMFVKYEIVFPSSDTGLLLVGVWNDLDYNVAHAPHTEMDDYLLEFRLSLFNNSNYVSFNADNTRFVLSPGLYKINLAIIFSGITVSEIYYTMLLTNGLAYNYFNRHETSANPESDYHTFSSSLYVRANGVDYFEIRCTSNGGDYFFPSSDLYNQLSIEYVK